MSGIRIDWRKLAGWLQDKQIPIRDIWYNYQIPATTIKRIIGQSPRPEKDYVLISEGTFSTLKRTFEALMKKEGHLFDIEQFVLDVKEIHNSIGKPSAVANNTSDLDLILDFPRRQDIIVPIQIDELIVLRKMFHIIANHYEIDDIHFHKRPPDEDESNWHRQMCTWMAAEHTNRVVAARSVPVVANVLNMGALPALDVKITVEFVTIQEVVSDLSLGSWMYPGRPPFSTLHALPKDDLSPHKLTSIMDSWYPITEYHQRPDSFDIALQRTRTRLEANRHCFEGFVSKIRQTETLRLQRFFVATPFDGAPQSFSVKYAIYADNQPLVRRGERHFFVSEHAATE